MHEQSQAPNCRRCSPCNISWPNIDKYRHCPDCRKETWQTYDSDRWDTTQASEYVKELDEAAAKKAKFDAYVLDQEVASIMASFDDELGSLLC